MSSYWWYITVTQRPADESMESAEECEQILYSAAEISDSIGTEVQELPDGIRMRIYYRADEDISYWRNKLLDALEPWQDIRIEDIGKVENQPWSTQSEEAFPPLPVGQGLVVMAPWHRGSEPNDRIPIYINPGAAFGTGYHESTQTALELMEDYFETHSAAKVIDVGTGSGILTIAALKLGADSVMSCDLDPSVLDEVEANMMLNDSDASRITLHQGMLLDGIDDSYDLLVANILLEPLLQMLPDIKRVLKPLGFAVFAGMTEQQSSQFKEALTAEGFRIRDEVVKDEWWGVSCLFPE